MWEGVEEGRQGVCGGEEAGCVEVGRQGVCGIGEAGRVWTRGGKMRVEKDLYEECVEEGRNLSANRARAEEGRQGVWWRRGGGVR